MGNLNDEELISLISSTSAPKYTNALYYRHWGKVYATCLY